MMNAKVAPITSSAAAVTQEADGTFEELLRQPLRRDEPIPIEMLLLNSDYMQQAEKIANYMASGRTTIPMHLRGNLGDCMAVVLQAIQWRMNPFAVAQKTHLVNGTLGYEAQLVNAVVTTMAPIKGRLKPEWKGDWTKVKGKVSMKKSQAGKDYATPGWNVKDEEGLSAIVSATMKGEDTPRPHETLLVQAITRNSTLWASSPDIQLAYLCTKQWARLHCPEVILGVYTPDELDESDDFGKRSYHLPTVNQKTPAAEYTVNQALAEIAAAADESALNNKTLLDKLKRFAGEDRAKVTAAYKARQAELRAPVPAADPEPATAAEQDQSDSGQTADDIQAVLDDGLIGDIDGVPARLVDFMNDLRDMEPAKARQALQSSKLGDEDKALLAAKLEQ